MITFSHKINSPQGLHAMPCANIAACVKQHNISVRIHCNGVEEDASDPISLMCLRGMPDDTIDFTIDGDDEEEVHQTLLRICKNLL